MSRSVLIKKALIRPFYTRPIKLGEFKKRPFVNFGTGTAALELELELKLELEMMTSITRSFHISEL